MKKNSLNTNLREYSRKLSPTLHERSMVESIYDSFKNLLADKCIQIGSYPRFTAITPFHDLDILYILGPWNEKDHSPSSALQSLLQLIEAKYKNPTNYQTKVSLQTHSVTIEFFESTKLIISVDIVPAYSYWQNDFRQDTYKVPEVIKVNKHYERKNLSWNSSDAHAWIKSDPRWYIEVATQLGSNTDFRKTVKFVKKWKHCLVKSDSTLKLKSFHLEQIVTNIFQKNRNIEIYDAIFQFFYLLPGYINTKPKIPDRANPDKYIDEYLNDLTTIQKAKIIQARDGFLERLERLQEADQIESLMTINFYKRHPSEKFLFDQGISMCTYLTNQLEIRWVVQAIPNSLPEKTLDVTGRVERNRLIKFSVKKPIDGVDLYKWKVRNDDSSGEPRWEITDHRTGNSLERTSYSGNHFVECYAIKDNYCIAKAHQWVRLP